MTYSRSLKDSKVIEKSGVRSFKDAAFVFEIERLLAVPVFILWSFQ